MSRAYGEVVWIITDGIPCAGNIVFSGARCSDVRVSATRTRAIDNADIFTTEVEARAELDRRASERAA